MSRYRFKLVPAGAIPRPLDIGVRMKRKTTATVVESEEQPEACVHEWDSWAVTVGGDPISGTPITFQNNTGDPVAIRVELLGSLCEGECIEWEPRKVIDDTDVLVDDVTMTPDGCTAIDIAFGHSDTSRYQYFVFALYPSVGGVPFGEALIFKAGQDATSCIENRDASNGWTAIQDGPTPPFQAGTTGGVPFTFPNGAFTIDFTDSAMAGGEPICNSNIYAELSFSGGDPDAYGDFQGLSFFDVGSSDPGMRLSANGGHDYTGISITITARWQDDMSQYSTQILISCE